MDYPKPRLITITTCIYVNAFENLPSQNFIRCAATKTFYILTLCDMRRECGVRFLGNSQMISLSFCFSGRRLCISSVDFGNGVLHSYKEFRDLIEKLK